MATDAGDRIRLNVPAVPEAARITRVGAAGLATRAGFTYQEVEQVRLAVGEATALLAGVGPPGGQLVVVYAVAPDGLQVEMHLEDGAPATAMVVPDLAARVLDANVDAWEVDEPERRVVLHKRRTDLDEDDD